MAFPSSVLGTQVEMKINGTWTSVVRKDAATKILLDKGVQIKRGAGGLQDKTPPSTCTWTWQDPNGNYLNENPRSPYFGVLPRNTPVRIYVPRTQAALLITSKLGTSTNVGLRCSCPDTAAISFTGDLDVRIEIEPKRWTRWGTRNGQSLVNNGFMPLCGKYGAAPNRTWHVRMREDGTLGFGWSTDGSNSASATCDVPIDMTQPRLAIKVTCDVDNGASHSTITFFTASSIGGTYTQLGTPQITAGAPFLFVDTTAPIELGSILNGDPAGIINGFNFVGRIYAFELRNGLGGTLVAQADFTGKANGTTSFADGLGNTWTVGICAEITNADYRFHGEFSAPVMTPVKTKSGTGVVVTVDAEAGGIIRRLQVNDAPLFSPLNRLMSSTQYTPIGYWTGEDASAADTGTASAGINGVDPAVLTDITFNGPDSTLAGSAGVMTLGNSAPSFVGTCKTTAQTTETHFVGLSKFPTVPVAEVVLWRIYTANSTIVQWNWCVSNTNYTLRGYNAAGTEVATKSTLFGTGTEPNKWIAFHLQLTNAAGTVTIKGEWMEMDSGITFTNTASGTLTFAGSNGVVTSVAVGGAILSGVRIAHVNASSLVGLVFWDGANPTFAKVAKGYKGETADARFIRICQLIGVQPVIWGALGDSEQMGAEPRDTGLNILYDCVNVGFGTLVEATDQPNALEYYTQKSTYNQRGTMSLTWAQLTGALSTTPDDTDIANDITLTRGYGGTTLGGSARATQDFGPMSTQAPPNGINPVPDGPTINAFADSRLPYLVQQMLLVRSWPLSRYPELTLNLEHPTFSGNSTLFLFAQRQCQPMRLTLTSLPLFMPPDPIELLVKGITEVLKAQQWQIKFALVPYGPYINSELNTGTGIPFQYKAAHTTVSGVVQQQLNAGITNSATSFAIKTNSGVLFDTTATNIPIEIGGELMTVGSVTGATSPQTMNSVTRGVNGYAAAHNANDSVIVYPTLKARL